MRTTGSALGTRGSYGALALCVTAYALYVTGYNVARRDVFLDGTLLYVARVVQLVTFLVCAARFRTHCWPTSSRRMGRR